MPLGRGRGQQITPRRSVLNLQRHARRYIQGARPLRCGWLDRQIRSMQEELDRAGHHRRPCGSPFALRIEEDGVVAYSRICRAGSGTLFNSDGLEGHKLAKVGRDVVMLQVGIRLGREEGMVREQ
jgi:hypothetical protein